MAQSDGRYRGQFFVLFLKQSGSTARHVVVFLSGVDTR